MNTYDVKIWDPRKIGDTAKGRWRVRWAVAWQAVAGLPGTEDLPGVLDRDRHGPARCIALDYRCRGCRQVGGGQGQAVAQRDRQPPSRVRVGHPVDPGVAGPHLIL